MVSRKGRIAFKALVVSVLFLSIFLTVFVLAAIIITTSSGGTGFSVNQSVNSNFNITVNNTNAGQVANITQVNVTLLAGPSCVFVANSNGSNSVVGLFANTTTVLSWSNTTIYLVNGSETKYFWFNMSCATPGDYNITVTATNFTNSYSSNLTLQVNDTTIPTIQFVNPSPINNTIQISSIPINITANDNVAIGTIRIYLSNSTGIVNSTSMSSTSPYYVNFSILQPGTYYVNASVNDSVGNINWTERRTYIVTVSSFKFNGTIKDENGNALNASNVNITIRSMDGWRIVGYASTTTNASGWFNLTVPDLTNQWVHEPSFTHLNGSFIDFKSKSLPAFPSEMTQELAGAIFYLAPAGTINITAINSTGNRISFRYQVKDTKLGYPIAANFDTSVSEAVVYVPRNRNYSVMIYPDQSMPVSYDWNNFSSPLSYTFGISSYNYSIYTLNKQFNTTAIMKRVSGYINYSGINGWSEFTVVPYLLEPGNMVHAEYGDLPYNLSSFNGGTDVHNLTSGFYNISLPGTAESSTVVLFATARNGSQYIGGFRNISLTTGSPAETTLNFSTMSGLFGSASNISMEKMVQGPPEYINITTAKTRFNLVNATNATIGNVSAHIEVSVDYSTLGAIEFTWMTDIQQSQAVSYFEIPLLNSTGIKEINIFASGSQSSGDGPPTEYAPRRVSFIASELGVSKNITMKTFSPQGIDSNIVAGNLYVGLYLSNSTCDVPNPPLSCILGDSAQKDMSEFNPIKAIMGGGKISFRMGTGNISVHYVNVDMMASGPPDALFDDSANMTTSGGFESAMRFGSSGPTIYDYVLVSMPYTPGSLSRTGLNESAQVNMSIPLLYDENWNVIWNTTVNGINGTYLGGNESHYLTYYSEWETLMGNNTCTTEVILNKTFPCYINTTSNRIWIRLPHFSGTGPSITGSVIAASSSSTTSTTSNEGSSGAPSFWTSTFVEDDKELSDKGEVKKELSLKNRVRLKVGGETHYVGVVELKSNSVVINVSSISQQATLAIGDTRRFELTGDSYYDLSVTLNGIAGSKADLTMKSIYEKITEETIAEEAGKGQAAKGEGVKEGSSNKGVRLIWLWVLVGVIVLVVILSKTFAGKKKR